MSVAIEKRTYSPEEYLELEINSEIRHEYRQGEILEVSGGTPNHNQIASNLNALLNFALRRQPYRTFVTDQRLWILAVNHYTYPDIMVVRDPLQLQEGRTDTVTNPLLIAEVLSKSTCDYDKGGKFSAYRTIPSFVEYLTIDQYTSHVEHYTKTDEGWLLRDYTGLETRLTLKAIALDLNLADIYDKVEFADSNSNRAYLTPEQYLETERHATVKHEYIDGEVYAMAGASSSHGLIVTNLIAILRPRLRGSTCLLFSSDMKVNIESRNRFYYPDIIVTCDDRDRATDYYKNHPKLIVEVLSDSTEAFDRGDKFSDYSEIETLEEYILVSQQHKRVDRFYRNSHQQWILTRHSIGETLQFESLDFECAVAEVYEDVEISD